MQTKKFDKSDIDVSLLGFGCWGIGKSDWKGAEDQESKRTLIKAMENGINFFDSALAYGKGHSEKLLGEAEKEYGKKVFIASKIPSKKWEWPAANNSTLKNPSLKITSLKKQNKV